MAGYGTSPDLSSTGSVTERRVWQLIQAWGTGGSGVAAGGTTGQVLSKKSNTDYDTQWASSGPHGDEVAYGERTSNVASAASAGYANGADLLAAALAFTADGGPYMVEVFVPAVTNGGGNMTAFSVVLNGAQYGVMTGVQGLLNALPFYGVRRITPASGACTVNVHIWSQGAFVSTAYGGVGGGTNTDPIFVRVLKVVSYSP
jgi:hypothetical protein